jgi:hypothetical protein
MNVFSINAVAAAAAIAMSVPASAAVIVSLGNTPTTTWSSTPAIGTPTASSTNYFSVGGTEFEQSITVGASPVQVDKIRFSYGAPKMTATLSLFIWKMGATENPTQPGFVDNRGASLLSSNTYAWDTSAAEIPNGSILTFDLTGTDEITLAANTSYIVALRFNTRSNNAVFGYTTSASGTDATSAYVGGALFYNEAYISGGNAGTDATFAIQAVPEPTAVGATGALAVACLRRRRRNGRYA